MEFRCLCMKLAKLLLFSSLVTALAIGGCREGDGDGDGDSDGDVDGDVDGDSDGDADGDADGDSDGDGDGDECDYPPSPYGTALGDVIRNLSFSSGNETAFEMTGDDTTFEFCDLYGLNEEHGGELTALMVFVTAGW